MRIKGFVYVIAVLGYQYFPEFSYVDSIGCTACKLNFYDWYQKINSLGKITDLAFLFYVNTKNFKILIHQII